MCSSDNNGGVKCGRCVLFVINLIVWIGSAALLGLGIYAIVDRPYLQQLTGQTMLMVGAIILICVGGIGFIISFFGCCGAANNIRCLVMTYTIVLATLLGVLLVGGIALFMLRDYAETTMVNTLMWSLSRYTPDTKDPTTEAWDSLQKDLRCCGVISYKDWKEDNRYYSGGTAIAPSSCCIMNPDGTTSRDCQSGSTDRVYTIGCYTQMTSFISKHAPILAIVAAAVALFMILGVAVAACTYPGMKKESAVDPGDTNTESTTDEPPAEDPEEAEATPPEDE